MSRESGTRGDRATQTPGPAKALGDPFEKALRILTAAAQTRQGLARKLLRAGFEPADVDDACDRAQEAGYIDDQAFAEAAVARRSRQGRGTRLIAAELRQKGLDGDLVQAALASVDPDREFQAAVVTASRHLRATAALEPAVRRQRVLARLYRAGFAESTARRAYADAVAADDRLRSGPIVDS